MSCSRFSGVALAAFLACLGAAGPVAAQTDTSQESESAAVEEEAPTATTAAEKKEAK